MNHVLSLIADPAGVRLEHSILTRACEALTRAGAQIGAADWLADGVACDVPFAGDPARAAAAARAALAGAAIDANVVPAAGRRKGLLVADMESTIIENEMLDDLAAMAGIRDEVAEITRRAMNDELDFRDALRERVALLAGLPIERMEEAAHGIRLMPGAEALVATMKAHGAYTMIVSGGFLFYTGLVRTRLDFDEDQGNDLEIAAGALTGEVREPVLTRDGKVNALRRIAAARGIGPDAALAVGDGANDIAMLRAAGLGVAFRAKPNVSAAVTVRIDHGDLTGLLYLQGYRQHEFVGPRARD
ncbi:MAG: phosphoserine phosphatase SerB [Rhodospirillales bacterium]|nr:phosphoserine phosphatase SerB [Rhodospirillales bacterium]